MALISVWKNSRYIEANTIHAIDNLALVVALVKKSLMKQKIEAGEDMSRKVIDSNTLSETGECSMCRYWHLVNTQ